jgi:hypothetical protein
VTAAELRAHMVTAHLWGAHALDDVTDDEVADLHRWEHEHYRVVHEPGHPPE